MAPTLGVARPIQFDIDYHVGSLHLNLTQSTDATRLAILGPSGSGKTALLRCVAGLYGAAPGSVRYAGKEMSDVAVEQRHVGYVAQGFTLFPHLTVWRQLTFAKGATAQLAAYWIEHLHLEGLEDRLPSQLSGGQRQRVALAQVLCSSPDVLLLDEPFSALDVPVRLELRRELRQLQRDTNLATVLVTHDPNEAAFLADELLIISAGSTLQSGATRSVFSRPRSLEVARLLGVENLHRATVATSTSLGADAFTLAIDPTDIGSGTAVWWSVRSEHVVVVPLDEFSDSLRSPSAYYATVSDVVDYATTYEVVVRLSDDVELHS
jgi:molybdate transport system permease protein